MFESERGFNQKALLDNPLTRRGCELWLERVLAYYGEQGGVDVEVIADQVALTPKSAAYLYGEFTPLELRYVPGSRPMLEAIVREHTRPGMSAREKALALMRRVRDNHRHGLRAPDLFHGGHEEDLLRRGARMCNEVSRLYACLCQSAGIPARLHCSHISGHMMNEVHVEGAWWWVDAMKGLAPVDERGRPVSAWDLLRDPKLFERQPKSFWDDAIPRCAEFASAERDPRNLAFQMARNRDCYFHPQEAMALGNYFVWELAKYTFPWHTQPADAERLRRARHGEYLNRKALGWPDYFYNDYLFDEELKMRV